METNATRERNTCKKSGGDGGDGRFVVIYPIIAWNFTKQKCRNITANSHTKKGNNTPVTGELIENFDFFFSSSENRIYEK